MNRFILSSIAWLILFFTINISAQRQRRAKARPTRRISCRTIHTNMNPNEKQRQSRLENKIKEIHNNIRHITQLAMSWFVFFVTINYASMGWLATSLNRAIIGTIAGAFIVQNFLGIVALCKTETAIMKMSRQAVIYENFIVDKLEAKSIPTELYTDLRKYMQLVLLSIVAAWVIYAAIFIWC